MLLQRIRGIGNMTAETEFSGPELCRLDAVEVVRLLKAGEVSPTELLDAAFARIDEVGPAINATPTVCRDRAYAAADKIDPKSSDLPGWLAGLPITIKDLMAVEGVRTTFGTKGFTDFVPDVSDALVERLEQRGGVVVGKSNTPEFGAGGNTFNSIFGPTLNPWNTKLNAGGSSGGAAASLATGEIWLSHGSDHGGSLRTPAAFCGVVGLRPSPGRAGGGPKDAGFFTEGVQGPMARTVTDCALFLDAMAGFEPRFPISFPAPDTPFQEAVRQADGKIRIAFTPDLGGFGPVDQEVVDHLQGVLRLLEGNGATIEEACPNIDTLEETYHTQRGLNFASGAGRLPQEVQRHFKQTLADNVIFGRSMTMERVIDAQRNRSTLYRNMVAFLGEYDVLAMPTVGCLPHLQSEEWVSEIGGKTLTFYMDWLRFAFLASTTGLPAISVPAGIGPRGLPVGIQLVGQPRGEAALLAAGRAVEVAVGGPLGPIDPVVN
jgi:amidase